MCPTFVARAKRQGVGDREARGRRSSEKSDGVQHYLRGVARGRCGRQVRSSTWAWKLHGSLASQAWSLRVWVVCRLRWRLLDRLVVLLDGRDVADHAFEGWAVDSRPAWVAKSLYSTPLLDGSVEFVHDPHCCVARDNSNFGTTRSVPSADCGVARAVCFMGSYAQFMSIPIPKYHSAGPRSGGNRLS